MISGSPNTPQIRKNSTFFTADRVLSRHLSIMKATRSDQVLRPVDHRADAVPHEAGLLRDVCNTIITNDVQQGGGEQIPAAL